MEKGVVPGTARHGKVQASIQKCEIAQLKETPTQVTGISHVSPEWNAFCLQGCINY